MDQDLYAKAEAFAETVYEEELDLLRTLGKIPAPSHEEDERSKFVKDWMLSNGFPNAAIDAAKNVVCEYNCRTGNDDLIVFEAHMDVVFPDKTPLPMKEDEDKLYAPGIGDDTANLACLLTAARFIIQNKVPSPTGILFVANACEEGLGNLDGTKEIFRRYGSRIKAFYSFDGYLGQDTNRAVGSYRYKISCKTIGGHSYANFGNPNAIELLCQLVEKLYAIKLPEGEKTTFNVGVIEGGSTVNSIAESASMLYEYRSPSQECLSYMTAQFKEALSSMNGKGGDFTAELLGVRPGTGNLDPQKMGNYTEHTAIAIRRYYDGEVCKSAGSTDSNIPLSMGIMANTTGTVIGGRPHTRSEWIEKKSLPTGLKIALFLMLEATKGLNQTMAV